MALLNCPICQSDLHIDDEHCYCRGGHAFPVENGVANIMLHLPQTAGHYSFQWGKELNYYKSIEDSEGRILKATASCKLGWDDYLPEALKQSESVLDIACGYGGVADIIKNADFKGTYLGFDINDTLTDIKNERFSHLPNYRFLRADMVDDIFTQAFDIAVCRSAIMYAPDARTTFASIARSVKPGGQFIISAYSKKSPMREMADDYFRNIFSKMTEREAFEALKEFTTFGKLLSDLRINVEIPQDLKFLEIQKGSYDIQRLIYYHFIKCFWNEEWGHKNSNIVNYDWYHPEYSWRFSKEELYEWYTENGFEVLEYRRVPAQHFLAGRKI